MLKLNFTNDALAFVKKLEPKQHRQVVNKIFDLLTDPRPHDSIEMRAAANHYRTDIGEFRIIYRYDKDVLYCVEVGRRNDDDVYLQFQRRKK